MPAISSTQNFSLSQSRAHLSPSPEPALEPDSDTSHHQEIRIRNQRGAELSSQLRPTSPPSLRSLCLRIVTGNHPNSPSNQCSLGSLRSSAPSGKISTLFNELTNNEIASLPIQWLKDLLIEDMRQLNSNFFKGLRAYQWRAFSLAQLQNISLDVWNELDGSQVNYLGLEQIRGLTSARLTDRVIGALDYYSIGALSCEQIQRMTQTQIAIICDRIRKIKLGGESQMQWFLLSLSDDQFHNLDQELLQKMSLNILRVVGRRLSEAQRAKLSETQRTFLAEVDTLFNRVRNISPNDIPRELPHLPLAAIPLLNMAQIAAINITSFMEIMSENVLSDTDNIYSDTTYWRRLKNEIGEAGLAYYIGLLNRVQIEQIYETSSGQDYLGIAPYFSPDIFSSPDFFEQIDSMYLTYETMPSVLRLQNLQSFLERLTLAQVRALTFNSESSTSSNSRLIIHSGLEMLCPRQFAELNPSFFAVLPHLPQSLTAMMMYEQIQAVSDTPQGFLFLLRSEQRSWLMPAYFQTIFARNIPPRLLTDEQVRWLASAEIAGMTPHEFKLFRPAQITNLNRQVFNMVNSNQLLMLDDEHYRSMRDDQLGAISAATLRGMGVEGFARFCRVLLGIGRLEALISTQEKKDLFKEFFAIEVGVITIRRSDDSTPPPSGGAAGGVSGTGSLGGGNSASSGGTLTFRDSGEIALVYKLTPGASNRKARLPLLPIEIIRRSTSKFWNDDIGIKYSTHRLPGGNSSQASFSITYSDQAIKEHKEFIRRLQSDQTRAIPTKAINGMTSDVASAFSPAQIAQMSEEQRENLPAVIRLNHIEKSLFNRLYKVLFNKTEDIPDEIILKKYLDLFKNVDRKYLQEICTPEVIRELGEDPDCLLLFLLRPEQLNNNGANDWSPDQFRALPTKVTQLWTPEHWNALSPYQMTGLEDRHIETIPLDVLPKLNIKFYRNAGGSSEMDQYYRKRIRALTQSQLQAIPVNVIAQLDRKFFVEYLSPAQLRLLTREQRQAISEETISKLPASFYYNLLEEKEGGGWNVERVKDLTEKQIVAMPQTFYSQFGQNGQKRLALIFLDGFESWQVRTIPKTHLDALSADDWSLLSAEFLNKLDDRIGERSIEQIQALPEVHIPHLDKRVIMALGDKIKFINPDVFSNEKAALRILTSATKDQLNGLTSAQIEKINVIKILPQDFAKICSKGGIGFLKKFSPAQITSLSAGYLKAIPKRIYVKLIMETHNKMKDEEIRQYAINVSPTQYRVALGAWKEGLENSEMVLTEQQCRQILEGQFRIKMERHLPEQTTPPTVIFSSTQRGWESDVVETQILPPRLVPQVDTRIPSVGLT